VNRSAAQKDKGNLIQLDYECGISGANGEWLLSVRGLNETLFLS